MQSTNKMISKGSAIRVLLFTLCFTFTVFAQDNPSNEYDVIIKNGRIVDGSGNPWVSGDIAIRGDRIATIGELDGASAKRVVDASGLVVSPGFIDMLGGSEI